MQEQVRSLRLALRMQHELLRLGVAGRISHAVRVLGRRMRVMVC
jgi:hypothetical protein